MLRYVDKMPSDMVRLLICHGGQDENVHFVHTSRLLKKMETAGKPFNLLVRASNQLTFWSLLRSIDDDCRYRYCGQQLHYQSTHSKSFLFEYRLRSGALLFDCPIRNHNLFGETLLELFVWVLSSNLCTF